MSKNDFWGGKSPLKDKAHQATNFYARMARAQGYSWGIALVTCGVIFIAFKIFSPKHKAYIDDQKGVKNDAISPNVQKK